MDKYNILRDLKNPFSRVLILLCLLLLGTAVTLCKNMNKYKWLAAVTCPKMYPVCVHGSILIYHDGYSYLDSGIYLDGEWGASFRENYTDFEEKPIPYRLVISWLSYAEGKFYKGVFDLPVEKMKYYFKEGYLSPSGKWETYNTILVGMAPEGVVVVWLNGNAKSVEIDRFKAKETDEISVEDVALGYSSQPGRYSSTQQYTDEMLEPETKEYISKYGLRNHIWDIYRQRFSFRTTIEYASLEANTNLLFIKYYNGEEEWPIIDDIQQLTSYLMKSRVKEITFKWVDKENTYFGACTFDEKEIIQVYQQIYKNNPKQKGEMIIRINSANDSIRIFLRNEQIDDTNEIMLHQTKITINKSEDE